MSPDMRSALTLPFLLRSTGGALLLAGFAGCSAAPEASDEGSAASQTPRPATWTKLAENPPSRSVALMVYDDVRERVLVASGNHATGPIGDFWSWDGARWSRLAAPPAPRASEKRRRRVGLDAQAPRRAPRRLVRLPRRAVPRRDAG